MGELPVPEKDGPPMDAPPPYTPRPHASSSNAFAGSAERPLPLPPLGHQQSPLPLPPLSHQQFPNPQQLPNLQQLPAPQQLPINRQFPPRFNIYRAGWGASFILGEHQDQPLYCVRSHTGWSGNPDVVLHNGPSESSPPLATANKETWSTSMTVELPPVRVGDWQATSTTEYVTSQGMTSLRYTFEVEVGTGGASGAMKPLREAFEWRHSRGYEVHSLGAGAGPGYKLVRLSGRGAGGTVAGDGNEVVAVWADYGLSLSKVLCFGFLGSGATGELGERWAVMAVITALGIWDQQTKRRRRK